MIYAVDVVRIGYGRTTIQVDADSEAEAQDKALDMAGEIEFSEHESEFETDGIKLLGGLGERGVEKL